MESEEDPRLQNVPQPPEAPAEMDRQSPFSLLQAQALTSCIPGLGGDLPGLDISCSLRRPNLRTGSMGSRGFILRRRIPNVDLRTPGGIFSL